MWVFLLVRQFFNGFEGISVISGSDQNHSTETGTLHWYGDSSSASSATVAGNNVTVLNALATTPTRTASSL